MSAVDGHFELLWRVVQNARRNGGDLSVLLLSYGKPLKCQWLVTIAKSS